MSASGGNTFGRGPVTGSPRFGSVPLRIAAATATFLLAAACVGQAAYLIGGGGTTSPLRATAVPAVGTAAILGFREPNPEIDLQFVALQVATNFVVAKVRSGHPLPQYIAVVVEGPPTAEEAAQKKEITPPHAPPGWRTNRFYLQVQKRVQWAADNAGPDLNTVKWVPFTDTVALDLGPGDGYRKIWIFGKWVDGISTSTSGNLTRLLVDHSPPQIVITSPPEGVTARPFLQIKGYSPESLSRLQCELRNSAGVNRNVQALVLDQYYDTDLHEFTTNTFQCFDVDLEKGPNTLTLRATDLAGNTSTNIYTYIFDLSGHTNPPQIFLDRPRPRAQLGETFHARGKLSDPTASVVGVMSSGGRTVSYPGLVEREGYFWVEDIHLEGEVNDLAIVATDAAGNVSRTNVVVYRSSVVLVMDDVPEDQLHQLEVKVTGKVTPPDRAVWVNGVQARVEPSGKWSAVVPVLSPDGCTAVFDATALPLEEVSQDQGKSEPVKAQPKKLVSVVTALGTNEIQLNASRPACGVFSLQISGAAGRQFVLMSSTNLMEWTPILTNAGTVPTFQFRDTNAASYSCRFFKVVPIGEAGGGRP